MSSVIKNYYMLCSAYNGTRSHIVTPKMIEKKGLESYYTISGKSVVTTERVIGGEEGNKVLVF